MERGTWMLDVEWNAWKRVYDTETCIYVLVKVRKLYLEGGKPCLWFVRGKEGLPWPFSAVKDPPTSSLPWPDLGRRVLGWER